MKLNQIHPYSKFILLTGFRAATWLLAEGLVLYLWCKANSFFLISSALSIAPTALQLLVICFWGAALSECFLRKKA